MDDFFVFKSSIENCLKNLFMVLKRCSDKDIVLNREKCHFMMQEGTVLGHKKSVKEIKVDKAKILVIGSLMPTT